MPTTFAQTIDGNYIYAQRAVQDKNGDDIDQTYAKLTDIPSGAQLVPTATSADADKVLTVNAQGTPGWAAVSAGNVFVAVYGTTTYQEVDAAYAAGKVLLAFWGEIYGGSNDTYIYSYKGYNRYDFAKFNANGDGNVCYSVGTISVTPSGWDIGNLSMYGVPEVSVPAIPVGAVLTKTDSTNIAWEAPATGSVTDVEVDGVSVVSQGVAAITTPTVDQTYNSASTNAQSGTAVADAIAGINQVPAATSADADKVLTVNAQGTPEWATGGGSQVQSDWAESDSSEPSYIENKPVPKTLTAGTGISITENASTITIANTAPDLPIGSWEDVSTEAQYNTTPVLAGGFAIKYNAMLKLVSVTADVNLDAGAANIFTWSNRLKPVANAFALGNGLTLYVSQTSLNQPASATNRWVNGVWMWPVVGE